MIHTNLQAIILAAGKSSRFNTGRTKLLEKMCGQELILYPIKAIESLSVPTIVVVGHQKEEIQQTITSTIGDSATFIHQEEAHGTAHAILTTRDRWYKDHLLIMHGDMPLVTSTLLQDLYQQHIEHKAAISFVIAHNADPALGGYGRVLKQEKKINVLESTTYDAHELCCVNAGIYIVEKNFLETVIQELELRESHKECTFSSIINIASEQGLMIHTINAPFDYVRGINTLQELWATEHIKRSELIKYWMECGVHFPSAHTVQIDLPVTIGSGSYIGSGVHLTGKTIIGNSCTIHEFSSIDSSIISDETTIFAHSIIKDSYVGTHAKIGPFAHIKEQSSIGNHCVIGNFVEIKKSSLESHTKAKHLSYLGDAIIGSNVNIGAGTITANHNGVTKNKTTIKDKAYVGAHSTLVAPITLGEGAFTAAGSVITHDVPANALALGRARQVIKEGYAQKMKERASKNSGEQDEIKKSSSLGATKSENDTATPE